jgi:hypothetical protein
MKPTHWLRRIGVLVFLVFVVSCSKEQPTLEKGGARIDRVDTEFDIDDGVTRIAIDNPWGEINVRGRDEREVGIHAVIQHLPPAFSEVKFESHRDGDTLRIEVVVAGDAKPDASPRAARADLAVYVPNDLALALSTTDARISAKRRASTVEAKTTSGEIQASSYGRLTLKSDSGQIRAIAIGKRWQGASEVSTDSGRIVLLVPTFGDVALAAETGGRLTTNFGLSIHALPDGRSEAHARYGAGSSPLQVHSRAGEIVLEQLVLLGDDTSLPEDDD